MKKMILALAAVCLISCNKNAEQVDAVKSKLTEIGMDKEILEKHEFKVNEVFDKDVYKKLTKKYMDDADEMKAISYESAQKMLDKAKEYVTMQGKATNKTFYIVDGYRVAGDTLNKSIFYVDDQNKVLDFTLLK